ncbi:MAG: EAL domain-containing protein [Acidimicrobiales bacterium]
MGEARRASTTSAPATHRSSYLKHLAIDELKIDKSFVATMCSDDSDLTIVRSTIDLAHNLGLTVVAEGVEDGPTLGRLAELGCDRVQGYYLSRPLPIADFDRLLADEDHLAAICSHLSV